MTSFAQKDKAGHYDIFIDEDTHQIAMSSDKQAYANLISDAIRTVRGELQLDTERGIPYFSTVFDKANKVQIWKHYVEKRITDFDFVVSIVAFEYEIDYQTKTIAYTMTIDTDLGEVTVNG